MMNRYKLFYICALIASLVAFLSVSTNSQSAESRFAEAQLAADQVLVSDVEPEILNTHCADQ